MVKVLLDSSALIYCISGKTNFIVELENLLDKVDFCVTESTVKELILLSKIRRGSLASSAKKALEIAKKAKILKSASENVDEDLLIVAKKSKAIVATSDKSLREKLIKSGVAVAFPTKGKRIRIDGFVEL
ncbi:MAG: PIN domain-containing protein [Thermoproteota archaeon]|jgi:rRNA-processing protein FCF1